MWQKINKMFLLCLKFLLVVFRVSTQNDYQLDFYRLEITSFDKDFFGNGTKGVTYKLNRTQPAVNATFILKIDFGNDLEVIVQANKFMSNEYREFPLRFEFNLCHGLEENYFGMATFYDLGNFPRCPFKKGHYQFSKWAPDSSKFPPLIPNGKYELILEYDYFGKVVMVITGYAEITRPVVPPPAKRSGH